MLSATWVGTAPGTTTIRLGQEGFRCLGENTVTEDQYRAADLELRERDLEARRKANKWQSVAAIASAGLTTLAILAGLAAWSQTGKLSVTR